ncbi:MAG: [FeFe] hydrogenase H-cluster radical SAM maturase HydE [Clostridia bacterium]
MKEIIDALSQNAILPKDMLKLLLLDSDPKTSEYLRALACKKRQEIYGKDIYIRGLIEFTNYCKNNCYYCGIRASNDKASRYRLTKEEILDCCKNGYSLGFRTFVLQGGEDLYYTDDIICDIVSSIKNLYPDCAITLSIGEKSKESYKAYKLAGADRFLLRHETANSEHYSKLHPSNLTLSHRKECLYSLKELGYQVGCGFMVGSPFQTIDNIIEDLLFIKEFSPEMVGIGPFLPHKDTPFKDEHAGSVALTLKLISIIRLLLPNVLLPATTALGTASENGRESGILAGCNVIMPNLSPLLVREKYLLYDGKISTGDEASESVSHLKKSMASIGYEIVTSKGDYKK